MAASVRKKCRCLLKDLDEQEIKHTLDIQIGQIPENQKVSDEIYKDRLAVCLSCEQLLDGMCRECGCFVEYRAVLQSKGCPLMKYASYFD